MSQICLVVLASPLMGFLCCPGFGQSSTPSSGAKLEKIKQNIKLTERAWLDAVYRLDAAAVDRSESNELTIIARGAALTKQGHIAAVRSRQTDAATPKQSATNYTLTNQTITVYGNIAVVTDLATVTTSDQSPVTSPGRYWQTEVWRNKAGTWKLIHLHASPIPRHK